MYSRSEVAVGDQAVHRLPTLEDRHTFLFFMGGCALSVDDRTTISIGKNVRKFIVEVINQVALNMPGRNCLLFLCLRRFLREFSNQSLRCTFCTLSFLLALSSLVQTYPFILHRSKYGGKCASFILINLLFLS